MNDSVTYFKTEMLHVRAGAAQTSLLDGIKVDYYGSQTPLNQLANISAPEPRLLTIEPYDKSSVESIEKAVMSAGLGLNPNNDGNIIRIPLPLLSEERRRELVKHVKDIAEQTHVSIRNERHEAIDATKKRWKMNQFLKTHNMRLNKIFKGLLIHTPKQLMNCWNRKPKIY